MAKRAQKKTPSDVNTVNLHQKSAVENAQIMGIEIQTISVKSKEVSIEI